MPSLRTIRPTKKIILPSSTETEEAWVTVYEKPLAYDVVEINKFAGEPAEANNLMLVRLIADWNFTIDGEKAPITEENVKVLDFDDYVAIMQGITSFEKYKELSDAKKNS